MHSFTVCRSSGRSSSPKTGVVLRYSLTAVWASVRLFPVRLCFFLKVLPEAGLVLLTSIDVILETASMGHIEALALQIQTAPATKAPPSGCGNRWQDVASPSPHHWPRPIDYGLRGCLQSFTWNLRHFRVYRVLTCQLLWIYFSVKRVLFHV